MGSYALRTFYKSHDAALFNDESVFIYGKDVEFNSNLYVSKFNNGGWNSIPLKMPVGHLYSRTSVFVKDYHDTASHVIFTSRDKDDNDIVFITKIGQDGEGITLSDAKSLEFISNMSIVRASATWLNGMIFISLVDKNTQGAYTVVLDSETYEQLSPVTLIGETLSSRYFDEMLDQMTGAIAQFSDDNHGCFLQLCNDSENISVFKLTFEADGRLSCFRLFVITERDIGAFAGLYDKDKSVLITCYCQFNSRSKNWNVNGVVNKVFSRTGVEQDVPYAALPLNSSPGIYYRPQVTRAESGYAVSWEGAETLHFKQFNEHINATSPETYYHADKPGNHRMAYIDGKYFVGYQNDCSEPRFVGLEYKNDEIKSVEN